jgi:predicted aldo/keto reductase-like oxidoreductase
MKYRSSRRSFLTAGVALPLAGAARFWPGTTDRLTSSSASAPQLSYRVLGKTGLKVTTLGFGCMITSDASVIERAADLGINLFDTARGYQGGNNERMVGAALKRKRHDVVISSKSGARDKAGALADLDTSLRELGTEHLDIWYLHGKSRLDEVTDELVEAQQIAKQQGKIRFAGVSTHDPKVIVPAMARQGVMDIVLVTYNFSMDPGVGAALAEGNRAGLGIVGMKVMAGGYRRFRRGNPEAREKLQRDGAMLAALKWVLKDPNVHTTIPSMTDMDQLDENLRAMAEPYGATEEKLLARQLDFITPLYCRMCGECTGTCARGLPVADILRHLTYAEGYGQFALGREEFRKLGPAVAAVSCADCAQCTVQCPHGIQVTARLRRAQELFA